MNDLTVGDVIEIVIKNRIAVVMYIVIGIIIIRGGDIRESAAEKFYKLIGVGVLVSPIVLCSGQYIEETIRNK